MSLQSLERVTSDRVTVEHRFAARRPEPVALLPCVSPASSASTSSSSSSRPTVQCATTVIKNCRCTERAGITSTRTYLNRSVVPTPIVTAIVANGCVFVPVRCLHSGVEAFVKRDLPADPYDECYHAVTTLFVQCIPTDAPSVHAFLTGGAFPNVRHLYLGETVDVDEKAIVQFVASFSKLTNVITFLPRYMSRGARTAFLSALADQ